MEGLSAGTEGFEYSRQRREDAEYRKAVFSTGEAVGNVLDCLRGPLRHGASAARYNPLDVRG